MLGAIFQLTTGAGICENDTEIVNVRCNLLQKYFYNRTFEFISVLK